MRFSVISGALAAVIATAALPLQAAEPAKPVAAPAKPAAQPTPEQAKANFERGVRILSLFNGALSNKDVPEDQKGMIFSCLYNNKIETISVATGDILAQNPKLDGKDAKTLYQVSATVCGVNKAPSVQAAIGKGANAAPAKPAPAKPTTAAKPADKGKGR